MRSGHALVLFSGGQDSTTCLAKALAHYQRVETIAFDYYSKNWITKQADSSGIAEWSADNDTAKLDADRAEAYRRALSIELDS